jgi:hypothetical protein
MVIIVIIATLCVVTKGSLSVGFIGLILALANNVTGGTGFAPHARTRTCTTAHALTRSALVQT